MRLVVYLVILIAGAVVSFITTNSAVFSVASGLGATAAIVVLDIVLTTNHRLWLFILGNSKYRKKHIRFSISYLFQIKVGDKYLLVRGARIEDQFQPVGGVYKRYSESDNLFRKLGILDDEHMPIDDISKDDLRVLVPGTSIIPFLKWFESSEGRETSPEREFREELIYSKILKKKNFIDLSHKLLRTVETKIEFDPYFQCDQILIAKIYQLRISDDQKKDLLGLQANSSDDYVWLDAQTIRRKGYHKEKQVRISNTSEWII